MKTQPLADLGSYPKLSLLQEKRGINGPYLIVALFPYFSNLLFSLLILIIVVYKSIISGRTENYLPRVPRVPRVF